MADRPIIFSAPMVRALLAGTKTQTRRLLALQGHRSFSEFGPSTTRGYDWHFRDGEMRWHDLKHPELLARLSWKQSDRLWVRETHYLTDDGHHEHVVYAEDAAAVQVHNERMAQLPRDFDPDIIAAHLRLRPSIHMPRWASRLTLLVTDVRVQRLQDISEKDADAEGVAECDGLLDEVELCAIAKRMSIPATECRVWFSCLWNMLHGPGAWEANPWVVALTFETRLINIDTAPWHSGWRAVPTREDADADPR